METNPIDLLGQALKKERDELREKRLRLKAHGQKVAPLLAELQALGCELSYPNSIDVRLIGDKHAFLALLRILNKHGFRTKKIEKGATEYFESFSVPGTDYELGLWVYFTSSVCRRVKVGTKMVEQDVYETVCDEIYPHGTAAAESFADAIPF